MLGSGVRHRPSNPQLPPASSLSRPQNRQARQDGQPDHNQQLQDNTLPFPDSRMDISRQLRQGLVSSHFQRSTQAKAPAPAMLENSRQPSRRVNTEVSYPQTPLPHSRRNLPEVDSNAQDGFVNAGLELLPYHTTHGRLDRETLIKLSDLAGSLKEIVLLTLGQHLDEEGMNVLERTVGTEAVHGIREFCEEEYVFGS